MERGKGATQAKFNCVIPTVTQFFVHVFGQCFLSAIQLLSDTCQCLLSRRKFATIDLILYLHLLSEEMATSRLAFIVFIILVGVA